MFAVRKQLVRNNMRRFASSSSLSVTHNGPNAVLGLARAPANLLSAAFMRDLRTTLTELDNDRAVRGIVLRSELPRIFSGGLDIAALAGPSRDELRDFWRTLQDLWLAFYGLRTPTVAAINGASPAGGCLMAMCSDERIMLRTAGAIGLNETQLGIVAPEIMFARPFANLVGERRAERFLQLGTLLTPEEALQVGLIDAVVDSEDELMATAVETLAKYQKIPSDARFKSKMVLRGPLLARMHAERDQELEQVLNILLSEPVQKNVTGYLAALKAKAKK